MFSAVDSHAADHAAIFEAGSEVFMMADEDGRAEEARVRSLCRRIVEHAVNYDAKYAGHLTPKRNGSGGLERRQRRDGMWMGARAQKMTVQPKNRPVHPTQLQEGRHVALTPTS